MKTNLRMALLLSLPALLMAMWLMCSDDIRSAFFALLKLAVTR